MQVQKRPEFKTMARSRLKNASLMCIAILVLSGCAANYSNGYDVKPSILEGEQGESSNSVISAASEGNMQTERVRSGFTELPSLYSLISDEEEQELETKFSSKDALRFAVDQMQARKFIHYVFGDLLGQNYSISESITETGELLTINIQKNMSEREVFELAQEQLAQSGILLTYRDQVFYFHRVSTGGSSLRIGVGRNKSDVPATQNEILQIVPINFGLSTSLERTLRDITDAEIIADLQQSTFYVRGSYSSVVRVIEMVNLLDKPMNRGKYVGLIRLKFLTPETFVKDLQPLLEGEGIPAGTNAAGQNKSVILVPMQQRGYVAVFSGQKAFVNRVEFWAEELDQPPQGTEKRYFIYAPKFARAADLGESLQPLIGGASVTASSERGNTARDTRSAIGDQSTAVPAQVSATSDKLSMVVDQRSNLLIFYTSGQEYELLLPLIERLDVVPRQIILEATIAEVTMNDEFKFGVEWAFQQGNWSASTAGAFGVDDIGGLALDWAANTDIATANAFKNNSLVNVLSNPTLLVRDGTNANITVGTEIPIVTSTISDPFEGTGAVQQNVQRRQIGLEFDVTPTINSQGVVIMQIKQSITNETSTGNAGSNNPTLFNRSISTEVVANSGQTIILGGLISENISDGEDGVPGLKDIPLLGNLFSSKSQSKSKTELVIMVTPRIIDDQRQWSEIREDFARGLKNVNILNK